MNISCKITGMFLFSLLSFTGTVNAQQKMSFDLAAIRNMRTEMYGSNLSCFNHFSEQVTGGIEMNRFYPVKKISGEEELDLSAWDFDLNFHYLVPLCKHCKFYPLTGFSHTAEKEKNIASGEIVYDRFWSFNTGAGMLWELGKWSPHIEYNYTWGRLNQQFLLAGISYELEWKKEKK